MLDDAAHDDAFGRDAAFVEGGAPDAAPADAGMPRCDPTTVLWASPSPFVCGGTATPRIDAVNLDGWNGRVSAGRCGLGVLLDHEYSLIGGLTGPTTQTVELRTYDGAVAWSAADSITEIWYDLVTLPDGSVVISSYVSDHLEWVLRSERGEAWRVSASGVEAALPPRTEDVDVDGTVHAFVHTRHPDLFGLPDTGEGVYLDLALAERGGFDATELARGAFRWIDAVRANGGLHVRIAGPSRWLDGTTTEPAERDFPTYLHFTGGRVDLREEPDRFVLAYGHADGSSTGIDRSPYEMTITHRAADGAVAWQRPALFAPGGGIDVRDVIMRADGRVLFGGSMGGTVTFDTWSHTAVGGGETFLAELDPCGSIMWARTFSGGQIADLSLQPDGRVAAILETGGLVDIGGVTVGDATHFQSVLLRISDAPP